MFGDADGLSGVVIDRFDDVVVIQVSTAGMETMRESLVRAVQKLVHPRSIVFKNDGKMREVEGLDSYVAAGLGDIPDVLQVEENGVRFEAPLAEGQKTGWFYDHRMNRRRLQGYASGKRVLDVFSYVGSGKGGSQCGAERAL